MTNFLMMILDMINAKNNGQLSSLPINVAYVENDHNEILMEVYNK